MTVCGTLIGQSQRVGVLISVYMSGNVVVGGPPERFNIMSNLTPSFEIGEQNGNDVWPEGRIVDGEFVFNGRLYLHDGQVGTVIDNFPKTPSPEGWSQRRRLDADGYELLDSRGERVFAYHVEGQVCFVDVNLYNAAGGLAAHAGQGGLIIHGVRLKF